MVLHSQRRLANTVQQHCSTLVHLVERFRAFRLHLQLQLSLPAKAHQTLYLFQRATTVATLRDVFQLALTAQFLRT
jgi:hypothetical protein